MGPIPGVIQRGASQAMKKATFGAGCFWGVEASFLDGFYYPSHEDGKVETALKELARLKIARLNACPT